MLPPVTSPSMPGFTAHRWAGHLRLANEAGSSSLAQRATSSPRHGLGSKPRSHSHLPGYLSKRFFKVNSFQFTESARLSFALAEERKTRVSLCERQVRLFLTKKCRALELCSVRHGCLVPTGEDGITHFGGNTPP